MRLAIRLLLQRSLLHPVRYPIRCIRVRLEPASPALLLFLLFYYLDNILVLKNMAKATMLRIVPCAGSPYKHVFHILEQTSMDMIAEIFNCATTSISRKNNWICEIRLLTLRLCIYPH
uniref:Developmentally-regulated GTP-binding protein 2 n=1 Tax=Arundo donax TaxID=35708 RepID=A0A0A9HC69_ARUDO